jgi:hypothetical protein
VWLRWRCQHPPHDIIAALIDLGADSNSASIFLRFGFRKTGAVLEGGMDLSDDPWIWLSSRHFPAEKLHAIGVVSFRWNNCEFWLLLLLCSISKIPRREIWAMAHDLGDLAICTRIETFMVFRGYKDHGRALIENVLEVYDICRKNRNSIVHAWVRASGPDPSLARKSRKPDNSEPSPFPSSLADIRRVADDIEDLGNRLWLMCCLIDDGQLAKPVASPEKVPLPELLWKNPPQGPRERSRRPV